MKYKILCYFLILLLFIPSVSADWSSFRGSNLQTGFINERAIGKAKWEVNLSADILSSPSITTHLYVSTSTGIFMLDIGTGGKKWKFKANGSVSSPAIENNIVYFATEDSFIYALDAINGNKVWELSAGGGFFSSPQIMDGVLYIGSKDSYLYAINASDGKLSWRFKTNASIYSSPALYDGKIFFGSTDGFFYAINSTGDIIWKYETNAGIFSSPAYYKDTIYFGSNDKLYALDANNGKLKWSFETDEQIISSPSVANDKIFFGSNKFYSLSLGGKISWEYSSGYIYSSCALIRDRVFFGSYDGMVYCLNNENGKLIWSFYTGEKILSSPSVGNGRVFIGAGQKLYALPLSSTQPPKASAGKDINGYVGQYISFFGDGNDPDGFNISFSWDFGDGEFGFGKNTKHAYKVAGEYTVTLTVNDGEEEGKDKIKVKISEAKVPGREEQQIYILVSLFILIPIFLLLFIMSKKRKEKYREYAPQYQAYRSTYIAPQQIQPEYLPEYQAYRSYESRANEAKENLSIAKTNLDNLKKKGAQTDELEKLYAEAIKFYENGDYERAIEYAKMIFERKD
ncbi:MAG: PQQ-binding-like beta-propeller repeat protein [Candidatus Thermoplasmatota archaeon]